MATIRSVHSLLKEAFVNPRTSINAAPHFVPLHLSILEVVLADKFKDISVSEFRESLVSQLTTRFSGKKIYSRNGLLYTADGKEVTINNVKRNTPALVYSGKELEGLLFANFTSVGSSFITPFLNKEMSKFLKKYKSKRSVGFDAGHTEIFTEDGKVLAAVPNIEKANRLIASMTSSSVGSSVLLADDPEEASQLVNAILDESNRIKADFRLHVTYGSFVEATLTKSFQRSLLSVGVNIVLIQDREENQAQFGQQEAKFASAIGDLLKKVHFSNSLEEEIVQRMVLQVEGKKASGTNKTVKLDGNAKPGLKNVTTEVVLGSKLKNISKAKTSNLATLQILLNRHLQDVISANMGDQGYPGGQRRILNYRTGRFAASAKVERLSESRAGLITAFYTYMKNPYQTFEPGYKQGSPKSRDPKLLIAKSIRDIAATIVGNRMRAVLV